VSRDIVSCLAGLGAWSDAAGLVVAGGVEGEFAEQLSVVGDDADVQVVDQQQDAAAGVGLADADVVVELCLQVGEGGCGVMGGEPVLQRLVEPLDLAAGLGLMDAGVAQVDVEAGEQLLEGDLAQPAGVPVNTAALSVNTVAGSP
jgi:hypothetical protein